MEDDLQQITVELKPKCDIEIVVPDVAAAGLEPIYVIAQLFSSIHAFTLLFNACNIQILFRRHFSIVDGELALNSPQYFKK